MIDEERFLELISAFMAQDLDLDLMDEFESLLEDEFYRSFFNTFCKTVELCHQPQEPLPEQWHITLIHTIEQTPQQTLLRKNPPRKRVRKPKK